MAIQKMITDPETGLPLAYHRVTAINQITNDSGLLQVCSYLSKENRLKEKTLVADESLPREAIYTTVHYYPVPYIDGMTCTDAYDYLKTLPDFMGATDILEDDE